MIHKAGTFRFCKNKNLYIYGASMLGKHYADQLKANGFTFCGFIDKNADRIKMEEKVYSLKDTVHCDKRGIIVVCVHNSLWHEEIAENLFEMGFCNILFIPTDCERNIYFYNTMCSAYEKFSTCDYDDLCKIEIPCMEHMKRGDFDERNFLFRREAGFVVCAVPIELIFIAGTEAIPGYKPVTEKEWNSDIPFVQGGQMIQLFDYFSGKSGWVYPSEYLETFKNVNSKNMDYTAEDFLRNRYELFIFLNSRMRGEMRYFHEEAPSLVTYDKGHRHFSLIDGHHRCAFLYTKGIRYMPVRMAEEDYENWKNESTARKIYPVLSKNEIDIPIYHPYFQGKSYIRESEVTYSLNCFYSCLYPDHVLQSSDTVLEVGNALGYYVRNFVRAFQADGVCYEESDQRRGIVTMLNELYHMEEVKIVGSPADVDGVSVLVVAGSIGYMDSLRKLINEAKVIFWVSGKEAEKEEKQILKSAKAETVFRQLGQIFNGSYLAKVGVFYHGL